MLFVCCKRIYLCGKELSQQHHEFPEPCPSLPGKWPCPQWTGSALPMGRIQKIQLSALHQKSDSENNAVKGGYIVCFLWQRSYPLGVCIAIIYKQYLPSQYVFYIPLELCFHISRLNLFLNRYLMLLFQEPVLFAFNFSSFQGTASDMFCLLVHSVCFTSFKSSYVMTMVFSSSMCLFQVTAWSK